jgi:drug/metabolite transporter (DMT)-like permease
LKNQQVQHIIQLNIAVLIISTSGVLGRYLSIAPEIAIWWRCLFAAVLLGLYCKVKKIGLSFASKSDRGSFVLSGLLLGGHWITYFYALQFGNVAIGMLSLFTYPVITALLEPLFFKNQLNVKQVFLGIMVLVGVFFLTPEFSIKNDHTVGVLFGMVSAVFYALRNILSKKHAVHYHGTAIMFYQVAIVTIFLWPVLLIQTPIIGLNDWKALVVLAVLTTSVGHTLFVMSFKNFNITTASIMSSIQPVWGIVFGMVFLAEIPSKTTILGGLLIVSTVVIGSIKPKASF